MKKTFKFYIIIWVIALAIFNVICFVTPGEANGINKFSGAFWFEYIFITLSFIGQLSCAYIAFKAENLKKLFYNIPIISISYTGIVLILIVGGLTMVISGLPNWIGIIICLLVLSFTVISVIKASVATDIVSSIDEKIAAQTSFIRLLTVDAQNLVSRASTPMLKEQCKKVYDALCYSDPMSNVALADVEQRIKEELDTLTDAVIADDLYATEASTKEITTLITERNKKAKISK